MEELAGTHYRVERVSSEILSRQIAAAWQAAAPFRRERLMVVPRPDGTRPLVMQEATTEEIARNSPADILRIFDREGNVVWHREYRRRDEGIRHEREIMDDLLRFNVPDFRRKHGIVPERPPALDAAGDAWTPAPVSDPWAGLPRPRRDLLSD